MGIWWLVILFFPYLYSYCFYPIFLAIISVFHTKKNNKLLPILFPNIYIITAAHNEEKDIEKKIESILKLKYPKEKIFFYLGLDNCADNTFKLANAYKESFDNMHIFQFNTRVGKPNIVNFLVDKLPENETNTDLLFLSDANVILEEQIFMELVKDFSDENIGLVDCSFFATSIKHDNDRNELMYSNFETFIKDKEGELFGSMMGPTGGGFMIRKTLFEPVSPRFIVDDFYIALNVFFKGKKAVLNRKAICYEDFSGNIKEEFNRKRRISAGNFQNLAYALKNYKKLNVSNWFCFTSHKVIRWISPIWVFTLFWVILLESIIDFHFIKIGIFIITLIIGPTVADMILSGINLQFKPLRRLSYFILMNLSLLFGFFDYLKGIKSNVWEPTKRS